jgi:pilus assembly protein CpaB
MPTERNQHRISTVVIRVASGFSTFILAVSLSTYYNPLGPNISPAEGKQNLAVVIAKSEIPIGARILAEQLQIAQLPRTVTVAGAFTRIDDRLIGRVAVIKIGAREPITESRLAPVGSNALLSSVIPEGYRAMTIIVDDVVGISGFVQSNMLVDIVVAIEPLAGGAQQETVSKIVLQNVKLLASGQKIDAPKNAKDAASVKTVTLEVTAEQAEKLALAASEGKLRLVVRNGVG